MRKFKVEESNLINFIRDTWKSEYKIYNCEFCGVKFESPYFLYHCIFCGESIKVALEKTKKSNEI